MRAQKQVSRETLLRWWSLLIRGAIALAIINFVVALVVRVSGGNLHPLFSDSDAWLLFLVSSVSLLAQAGLMRLMQLTLLRSGAAPRPRQLRALMGATGRSHGRHAGRRRRVAMLDWRDSARPLLRGL